MICQMEQYWRLRLQSDNVVGVDCLIFSTCKGTIICTFTIEELQPVRVRRAVHRCGERPCVHEGTVLRPHHPAVHLARPYGRGVGAALRVWERFARQLHRPGWEPAPLPAPPAAPPQ